MSRIPSHFRLDSETLRKLRILSNDTGKSKSAIVRIAVDKYLDYYNSEGKLEEFSSHQSSDATSKLDATAISVLLLEKLIPVFSEMLRELYLIEGVSGHLLSRITSPDVCEKLAKQLERPINNNINELLAPISVQKTQS